MQLPHQPILSICHTFIDRMDISNRIDETLRIIKRYEDSKTGMSLDEATNIVDNICIGNEILRNDVTKILQYPSGFFDLITSDSKSLLQLMYRTNAILGGIQATAFLFFADYINGAPWDFYCSLTDGSPDKFVASFETITTFKHIEYKYHDTGHTIIYYRSYANDVNARIFIGPKTCMESILDLKYSYEQTAISAVAAISFWPRLNKLNQFLLFKSNPGHSSYLHSNITYIYSITDMRKVRRMNSLTQPSMYSVEDDKAYVVIFDNKISVNQRQYAKTVNSIRGLIYCVFNSSTRYLGTVGNMV